MSAAAKYPRSNPEPPKKRPSTITIPTGVGQHVKLAFAEMKRKGKTYYEVEAGSGVNRPMIKARRHKIRPSLDPIEAVLGLLNFDFVPLPRVSALPPEIADALKPIANCHNFAMPEAVRFSSEVAFRDHHLSALQSLA